MLSLRTVRSIAKGPKPPPSRESLKAALAAHVQAQQTVDAARATVERLKTVLDASDEAARTAAKAVNTVNESRSAWVSAGCRDSGTRNIQALEAAAAEATRAAESAARDAKLVSREIVNAQSIYQSAQFDLRTRDQDIAAEIGAIIAAEQLPILQRYEQVAKELRSLRFELKALERVLDPDSYEDAGLKSHEGARLVQEALRRGLIQPWDAERDAAQAHDFVEGTSGRDESSFEQFVSAWRERAAELRRNPDAE